MGTYYHDEESGVGPDSTRSGGAMRKTLVTLLAFAFVACGGGSPTGSGDESGVVSSLDVVDGDGQSAPVQQPMPDSVVGEVTDDNGDPIEGVAVNFEVPAGDSAGMFETNVLQTNADGRVVNQLTAGVEAWTSRVVVEEDSAYTARLVASRAGRPDVVSEFTFGVDPGPAAEYRFALGGCCLTDDPFSGSVEAPATSATDEHGNPALFRLRVGPGMLEVDDGRFGWPSGRTLALADSAAFVEMTGDTLFYDDGSPRQIEGEGPELCLETASDGPAISGTVRIQKRFDLGEEPTPENAKMRLTFDQEAAVYSEESPTPVCP